MYTFGNDYDFYLSQTKQKNKFCANMDSRKYVRN